MPKLTVTYCCTYLSIIENSEFIFIRILGLKSREIASSLVVMLSSKSYLVVSKIT